MEINFLFGAFPNVQRASSENSGHIEGSLQLHCYCWVSTLIKYSSFLGVKNRASDILRKKKQNFAGFSGANSRKNRPISRDFRGKKSKFAEQSADFGRFSWEKGQNSQKNRPISRDFSGKKSIFEGFSGANS